MNKSPKQNIYFGWDAIADALGRKLNKPLTTRTLQNWEKKYDLPIRRIGTSIRAGCFAYEHEIPASPISS